MKKNKLKLLSWFMLLFTLLLVQSANAILNVDFGTNVPPANISFYWVGDDTASNQPGRSVSSDNTATLGTAAGEVFAKQQYPAPNTQFYQFYATDAAGFTGSQGISARVWDGEDKSLGRHYSALNSADNPVGDVGSATFNPSPQFVAAIPRQAVVSGYTVASDVNILVSPSTTSGTVTFRASEPLPPLSAPNRIEISGTQWQYRRNGGEWTAWNGVLRGDLLVTGDIYEIQARHTNAWGSGDWSESVFYTVGAGAVAAAGGGAIPSITYPLTVEAGLGLNSVAVLHTVPFNVTTAVDTTAAASRVSDFVSALNLRLGAADAVRAIGWLENTRIVGYMISYSGGIARYTSVGGADADGAELLTRGQSIQLYVTTPGSVTFSQP